MANKGQNLGKRLAEELNRQNDKLLKKLKEEQDALAKKKAAKK